MRDFRELKVWEKAHQVTLALYRATQHFPKEELYGLTSQIRRAAASMGANIAEGCGKNTDPDLARFLQIALGSASELEYHLLLAKDLGFSKAEEHAPLTSEVVEVKKMLTGFIHYLDSRSGRVPS
ncbi:MAG TPA: four helix bundle protein [Terriglobales bacterium]|nr:four helix bundle protein [Terriglobales bacterium]